MHTSIIKAAHWLAIHEITIKNAWVIHEMTIKNAWVLPEKSIIQDVFQEQSHDLHKN